MHEIITFAQSATPLMILAIAVVGLVYAIYKLSKGEDLLKKVSNVQDEKYPKIEQGMEIMAKLDKIAGNHLHELPEMKQQINQLSSDMTDVKINIAEIKTALKFIIKDK